jgi:DivIVA domain-containing protein
MSDSRQFRVTRRGYDPDEVDRAVGALTSQADAARQRAEELEGRVHQLEAAHAAGEQVATDPLSFAHLGDRVGQILSLAEDEAHDLLERARAEIVAMRDEATAAVQAMRDDADHYATQRRSDADTEAARILEDAKRTADDRIDAADRDAAARLQEAEAVYEDQRAKAAKAAADFETTLAHRRKLAEEEFEVQMEDARTRLADLERQIERTRAEADAERTEAQREAQRLTQEAQEQAAALVSEAKLTASRVRADSARELAAASQRRDSINAQLANVRQMLATLTGSAPAALLPDDLDAPDASATDEPGDVPVAGADPADEAVVAAPEADSEAEDDQATLGSPEFGRASQVVRAGS